MEKRSEVENQEDFVLHVSEANIIDINIYNSVIIFKKPP